jgi:hypothetical protein
MGCEGDSPGRDPKRVQPSKARADTTGKTV